MAYRTQVGALLSEAVELIRRASTIIDAEDAVENPGGPTIPVDPVGEQAVVYGVNGFTNILDPRLPDATRHSLSGEGKVVDMNLTVHVLPQTKYRCTKVYVLGEDEAQGKTIATVEVRNRDGNLVGDTVILATNYQGGIEQFDDRIPSKGDKIPVEHIISNSFGPPSFGPLAIYLQGPGGPTDIASDVVGSLGLPGGRHVSFFLVFTER